MAIDLDARGSRSGPGEPGRRLPGPLEGLSETAVRELSATRGEPGWVLETRLGALGHLEGRPMARWLAETAPGLELPEPSRRSIGSLRPSFALAGAGPGPGGPGAGRPGIPGPPGSPERPAAAGLGEQEGLERRGVVRSDLGTATREHPELVRPYLEGVLPAEEDELASLCAAAWTGGWFVYVPPGVRVELPLPARARPERALGGWLERSLVVAGEGAEVRYVEGCLAPTYSSVPVHAAVVEIVALAGSRVTCTTAASWSANVCSLVSARVRAEAGAHVEWVEGSFGAGLTVRRAAVHLMGPGSSGEVAVLGYAGAGQVQATAVTLHHLASGTSSRVHTRSVTKDGGRASCRARVQVGPRVSRSRCAGRFHVLALDGPVASAPGPVLAGGGAGLRVEEAATISPVGEEQLFYLMSRGLTRAAAAAMVANGFLRPITRTLPVEQAVEWSRLVEVQLEGSVG